MKKILIADNSTVICANLARKLISHGFDVFQAADQAQAMDIWLARKPDLVLLDLLVPSLEGLDLLKSVRDHPDEKIATTPVIVFSNCQNQAALKQMAGLDALEFLSKTAHTTNDILEKITGFFKKQR